MINTKMKILGFFSVTLIVILFCITFTQMNNDKKYKVLENDLEESAGLYMIKANILLTKGEKYQITDKMLEEEQLLPDMKVDDDECSGSVEVIKKLDEYVYNPYIKCKNYESFNEK
jgi:hypothetical protein